MLSFQKILDWLSGEYQIGIPLLTRISIVERNALHVSDDINKLSGPYNKQYYWLQFSGTLINWVGVSYLNRIASLGRFVTVNGEASNSASNFLVSCIRWATRRDVKSGTLGWN